MSKLSTGPVIDLDAIASPIAGTVHLRGKPYQVLQATPATIKLMQSATAETWLTVGLTAVLRCVPNLEDEVLGIISAEQLQLIIALSVGNLELVAQLDPNHDPNVVSPAPTPPSPG